MALQEKLGHTYKPQSKPNSGARRGKSIRCSADVYDACADMATGEQEYAAVLCVDAKYRLIKRVVVAVGTLASVECHPREVFREAVREAAAAIFFVHNHPSGDPEPSPDDLALTARLRDAGRLIGIVVLDSLIVAGDGYVSLVERGML